MSTISECATIDQAFDAIDRLASEMVRTGARSDFIELLVVDADGNAMRRPGMH